MAPTATASMVCSIVLNSEVPRLKPAAVTSPKFATSAITSISSRWPGRATSPSHHISMV
jgi:hypothetical protein